MCCFFHPLARKLRGRFSRPALSALSSPINTLALLMLAQLCSHLGWSDRRMSHCVSVWPALNRSEPYTVKSSRALLVLVVSLLTFITGAVLMRNPFRRARVNGVQNQLPTPLLTSQLGPTEV